MSTVDDAVRAEWERLCERFRFREEMYDRTVKRHRLELAMLFDDLAQAGSERDRFAKAHPEVSR